MRALRATKQFFQKRPIVWKGLVTCSLFTISDLFTQVVIEGKRNLDLDRNKQFLVIGVLWQTPAIQVWYSILLPKLTKKYISRIPPRYQLGARLLLDTIVFAPFTYMGFYIIKSVLDDGLNLEAEDLAFEMRNKMPMTLLVDWMIWIPANYVNFKYVKVHYQSLFVGVFTFFFNILLSLIAYEDIGVHKGESEDDESDSRMTSVLEYLSSKTSKLVLE